MNTVELLSEGVADATIRERAWIEGPSKRFGDKIVLLGAGKLGRKAARSMIAAGFIPVAFADNDLNIEGSKVEGIEVVHSSRAVLRWGGECLFVVTTFLPRENIQTIINDLVQQRCREVIGFLPLGWRYDGVLPHFGADRPSALLRCSRELLRTAALWDDEISRETFRQQLCWRLRADFSEVGTPSGNQYFPLDLIKPNPHEIFVDGGAFDGDTLRQAPWPIKRAIAIEPDPLNALKLKAPPQSELRVHHVALGNEVGKATFDASGTMGSARSEHGRIEVNVDTLDRLLRSECPTFIKLDVEGDELVTLQGSHQTLKRHQPIVAVCVYHKPADLWEIPLYLHELLPTHRKFLRIHEHNGFELVMYAIPKDRCR